MNENSYHLYSTETGQLDISSLSDTVNALFPGQVTTQGLETAYGMAYSFWSRPFWHDAIHMKCMLSRFCYAQRQLALIRYATTLALMEFAEFIQRQIRL